METAAAAMLEAGVGRFSRAPAMAAALVAEMWAPLAVVLAALATLPSLLRRLQGIVLRLRSRGKEAIQSHISTYCSSSDDDDDEGEETSSDDEAASSFSGEEEEEEQVVGMKRVGYLEQEDGGCCFPWGGSVVRTWQDLPRRFSGFAGTGEGARFAASGFPVVWLWGASGDESWWSADEGEDAAEEVVVGWRRERDHAGVKRRVVTPSEPTCQRAEKRDEWMGD